LTWGVFWESIERAVVLGILFVFDRKWGFTFLGAAVLEICVDVSGRKGVLHFFGGVEGNLRSLLL